MDEEKHISVKILYTKATRRTHRLSDTEEKQPSQGQEPDGRAALQLRQSRACPHLSYVFPGWDPIPVSSQSHVRAEEGRFRMQAAALSPMCPFFANQLQMRKP